MKKFNIKTTDGEYEVTGTHYSMVKYLTVYNEDKVVFEIIANKVISLK